MAQNSHQSKRNVMADNIQRAHDGRRPPAMVKHCGFSDFNQRSSVRTGGTQKCYAQPFPSQLMAGQRIKNPISMDSNGFLPFGSSGNNGRVEQSINTTSNGNKKVRKQMKQVVGDLETVIGELGTVMGDLRTLVSQIDVVAEKLHRSYQADKATRPLSTSVLEVPSSGLTKANRRHSSYQSCNINLSPAFNHIQGPVGVKVSNVARPSNATKVIARTCEQDLAKPVNNHSQTKSTPVKMRMGTRNICKCSKVSKRMPEKLSNRHSAPSTSREYDFLHKDSQIDVNQNGLVDIASSMDSKAILAALPRRKTLIPPSFFDAIEHDLYSRVVSNKNRRFSQSNTQNMSKASDVSRLVTDCPLCCATRLSKSSCHKADRSSVKLRNTFDQLNTLQCSSRESESTEYCGVYEKELDERLESEFDDHLDVFDTLDSREFDDLSYVESTSYQRKYNSNINTRKDYTMDEASPENSLELSDDCHSELISKTSSDILNDNFLPLTVNPSIVNYSWRSIIGP